MANLYIYKDTVPLYFFVGEKEDIPEEAEFITCLENVHPAQLQWIESCFYDFEIAQNYLESYNKSIVVEKEDAQQDLFDYECESRN